MTDDVFNLNGQAVAAELVRIRDDRDALAARLAGVRALADQCAALGNTDIAYDYAGFAKLLRAALDGQAPAPEGDLPEWCTCPDDCDCDGRLVGQAPAPDPREGHLSAYSTPVRHHGTREECRVCPPLDPDPQQTP